MSLQRVFRTLYKPVALLTLVASLYGCPKPDDDVDDDTTQQQDDDSVSDDDSTVTDDDSTTPADDDTSPADDDDTTLDQLPVFKQSTSSYTTQEEVNFSQQYTAANAMSYQIMQSTLPTSKYSFNQSTGLLQLNNTNDAEVGVQTFMIRASNNYGNVDHQSTIIIENVNEAPVIVTSSLPTGTSNVFYNTTLQIADEDIGDIANFSLTLGNVPELSLSSSGVLSGTPTQSGDYNIEVTAEDGEGLTNTKQYTVQINPAATVEFTLLNLSTMQAIDATCGNTVTLTAYDISNNLIEQQTAPVTCGATCAANFTLNNANLDFDVEVPSTNTGSNCYGGFSSGGWLEVLPGANQTSLGLIPEALQNDVISVVGSQITMNNVYGYTTAFPSRTTALDSMYELVLYMSARDSIAQNSVGWNSNIRNGTSPLPVDLANYNTASGANPQVNLQDVVENEVIPNWQGALAQTISSVSVGTGLVHWLETSNWQIGNITYQSSSDGTITSAQINYSLSNSQTYGSLISTMTHEFGHLLEIRHTNVDGFIMKTTPSSSQTAPHPLEIALMTIYMNLGPNVNIFYDYTP